MHVPFTRRLGSLAAIALSATAVVAVTAASASAAATLYVNGSIAPRHDDTSCTSASYTTIGAAVTAAAPGSKIVVCAGTYHEDVTVSKPLTIVGQQATVNATGLINGFTIPTPGAGSRIEGFTVIEAIGEGVLAVSTNHVSIVHNVIENNDQGGTVANTYAECQAQGQIPGDCGEGVHLMSTTNSRVIGNVIKYNSGGVLLSDEIGPTDNNIVASNWVGDNASDCGITLAGHNPAGAPDGVPNPAAGGVYDNLITRNVAIGNGLLGQGAGVVLAAGIPIGGGAVYNNTVSRNILRGNGLAGVTVHNHVPGQDLNGNKIIDNQIGTNNLDGDPDFAPVIDPSTTGIFVGTATPLQITIEHNVISSNVYGVFLTGPVSANNIELTNVFTSDTHEVFGT
jgi:nitrous oxidase accessory protein NosD